MKYLLEKKIDIGDKHCDYLSKLKMSQLFSIMQDGATESAKLANMGRETMILDNRTFVLSRMSVEVKKMPKLYETIELVTWPKGRIKMFYLRDYMFNLNEENIINASAVWAIIDLKSRKLVIDKRGVGEYKKEEVKNALYYIPSKIRNKDNMVLVNEVNASYSLTDPNGHINNTRYIEWIYDVLPKEILQVDYPYRMDINYINEVYYKDKVNIFYSSNDKGIIVEGRVMEKVCFLAKFSKLK